MAQRGLAEAGQGGAARGSRGAVEGQSRRGKAAQRGDYARSWNAFRRRQGEAGRRGDAVEG